MPSFSQDPYVDKTASLTPLAARIILHKATEYPNTGQYNTVLKHGTYLCRRCGLALFRASNQFHSGCGWPSFDGTIEGTVAEYPDVDGKRTEIVCARCAGHLGHVFYGEYLTRKNTRHCVNAASIDFVEDAHVLDTKEAIVAGGCFWGVEFYLKKIPGVLSVESGYIGGHIDNPSYEQVCTGQTGHFEAVRVVYDCNKTDYTTIIKRFFEIHDPTQRTGQGPDIGQQYQSAIFCYTNKQRLIAQQCIHMLTERGYQVATQLHEMAIFWPAEGYHQNYYQKHQKLPYCHRPERRFD